MITASTGQRAAQDSVQHGAAGFLLKPFEPEELKEKVFQLLKRERI